MKDVEQSDMMEAIKLIGIVKDSKWDVLWVKESTELDKVFHGVEKKYSPLYRTLWYNVLSIVYDDKEQLIKVARELVKSFGSSTAILDVNFDPDEQILLWKIAVHSCPFDDHL